MRGSADEAQWLALLLREQAVVGAKPRSVLRVRTRVVRQAAKALVAADSGKIPPARVDDVEHLLWGRQRPT